MWVRHRGHLDHPIAALLEFGAGPLRHGARDQGHDGPPRAALAQGVQQALGARQVAVGREERDVGLARLRDFRFARALRGVGVDGVVEMRRRYKDDRASSSLLVREIPNACAFVTRRAALFFGGRRIACGWCCGGLHAVLCGFAPL